MRRILLSCVAALAVAGAQIPQVHAQVSAAGWVGAGVFDDDPAMTVDLGVDYSGDNLTFGLGGRARFLAGDGFRERDWDEPSELASLLRYARYERLANDSEVIVVAGRLGDVVLGHAAIIDGYETALNLDHSHLGVQLRTDGRRLRFDALVDDVVAPRLMAARAVLLAGRYASFGATAAADVSAPSNDGTTVVPFAVLEAAAAYTSDDDRESVRGYLDLVSMPRIGAGAHLGVTGRVTYGGDGTQVHVGARGELRLSGDGYIPGWIGPLYEVTRVQVGNAMDSQLDVARRTSGAKLTGLGALSLQIEGIGSLHMAYASRPGLDNLLYGRLVVPELAGVQAAVWAAAELGASPTRAAALEVRAKLNRHAFVVVEGARLYRDATMGLEPVWSATVAIGAAVGE